jgi:hypothetical protein
LVNQEGNQSLVEMANIALNLIAVLREPETFEEVYSHTILEQRIKWRDKISKEFNEKKENRTEMLSD